MDGELVLLFVYRLESGAGKLHQIVLGNTQVVHHLTVAVGESVGEVDRLPDVFGLDYVVEGQLEKVARLAEVVRPVEVDVLALAVLPLVVARSLEHVHAIVVELVHGSREVEDVEAVGGSLAELTDLEVEPVGVAARIRVHLHQQVVLVPHLVYGVQVGRVKVAALKVTVKCKDVVLVDLGGQSRLDGVLGVGEQVLRRVLFEVVFFLVG